MQTLTEGLFDFSEEIFDSEFHDSHDRSSWEVTSTEVITSTPVFEFRLSFLGQHLFSPCAPSREELETVFDNADYESLWQEMRSDSSSGGSGGNSLLVFLESSSFSGRVWNEPSNELL